MVIFSTIYLMLATLLASSTALSTASLDNSDGFRWGWSQKQSTRKEEAELPPWERPPPPEDPPTTVGPLFEVTTASIVTRPGADVMLPCRVRNLGDKVVSWIRTRDLHILSSHVYIFTTDLRFSVSHPEGDSASWDLRLKGARPADQGLYECQVNTEPKMKQAVMLTVNEMELSDSPHYLYADEQLFNKSNMARILGPREQIVHEGSTVTLTCEVRTTANPPPPTHHHAKPTRLVDWLYEGQLLTFQASRGGISVDTERNGLQVWSRLTLGDVTIDDTGRYTCKPLQAPSAVVTLVVVEGETMGAMYGHRDHHHSNASSASYLESYLSIVTLMALLIFQLA